MYTAWNAILDDFITIHIVDSMTKNELLLLSATLCFLLVWFPRFLGVGWERMVVLDSGSSLQWEVGSVTVAIWRLRSYQVVILKMPLLCIKIGKSLGAGVTFEKQEEEEETALSFAIFTHSFLSF